RAEGALLGRGQHPANTFPPGLAGQAKLQRAPGTLVRGVQRQSKPLAVVPEMPRQKADCGLKPLLGDEEAKRVADPLNEVPQRQCRQAWHDVRHGQSASVEGAWLVIRPTGRFLDENF